MRLAMGKNLSGWCWIGCHEWVSFQLQSMVGSTKCLIRVEVLRSILPVCAPLCRIAYLQVSWFLVTCVTELSYFVIANLVPNLADWMSLISSTNGFSLMLLFPALFALRLGSGYRYLPLHERRLHVGVVVLTVVLMFLGTISSLHQIASGANSSGGPFSCA